MRNRRCRQQEIPSHSSSRVSKVYAFYKSDNVDSLSIRSTRLYSPATSEIREHTERTPFVHRRHPEPSKLSQSCYSKVQIALKCIPSLDEIQQRYSSSPFAYYGSTEASK